MPVYVKIIFQRIRSIYLSFFLQQGHGIRFKSIDNCAGAKPVIKIDKNSTISVDEDCMLSVNICGETTGFKTGKVRKFLWFDNNFNIKVNYTFPFALTDGI